MYNGFQELRNVKTQANSKIIHNEDNGNLYYYNLVNQGQVNNYLDSMNDYFMHHQPVSRENWTSVSNWSTEETIKYTFRQAKSSTPLGELVHFTL